MSEIWDARYASQEYIYGKAPNVFLEEVLNKIEPGKILFLGEGEGRNAVYAASLGWEVDAVDYSSAGKEKADKLAAEKNVKINYQAENLADYNPRKNYYDAVVLIYLHLDEELRESVSFKSISALKSGGKIILEAFEKEQLKYSSGGPASEDLLYSLSEIAEDFMDLEFEKFSKEHIDLNEGNKHKGKAAVIRFVGRKE